MLLKEFWLLKYYMFYGLNQLHLTIELHFHILLFQTKYLPTKKAFKTIDYHIQINIYEEFNLSEIEQHNIFCPRLYRAGIESKGNICNSKLALKFDAFWT